MRKVIPTNAHAFIDYGAAVILLAGPWILAFQDIQTAKFVFVASGALVIILSLFTRYEGGVIRVIPMKFHLTMDVILGLFLLLSPWIFGFNDRTWLWHVLMGTMSVLSGIFTVPKVPQYLSLKGH